MAGRTAARILLAAFFAAAMIPFLPASSATEPSHYVVTRTGPTSYQAMETSLGTTYTGSLKSVVESAVADLDAAGGGLVTFQSGEFDLGSDHFRLRQIDRVTFQGQGIDLTILRNYSSASSDTEVFDIGRSNWIQIRDMTVFAGGAFRSTSDAIDCDTCDDSLIENVKVTGSRARGIIFDGKDNVGDRDALRNTIRNCIVVGVPSDGIELLASSQNTIQGCQIIDVGGHGIQITKSSNSAPQANKPSNDNILSGNTIENSGSHGINIISSHRNQVIGNTILNSSDDISGRDGIRIESSSGFACDDNVIEGNTATDNQAVKTQSYGLNITSSACHGTVVGTNNFSGNSVGEINDQGTGTVYVSTATATATFTPSVTTSPGVPTPTPTPTLTPTSTPVTGGLTFTPVADAYVNAANPTANFGDSFSLRADGSPEMRSYLRFEVVGLPGAASHATLRLFANSRHRIGYAARGVAEDNWNESTITFNNAPPVGASVAVSGGFASGTWTEVDVTTLISGNGTVSIALTTSSTTGMNLASREVGATAPQLVIDSSGSSTATPIFSSTPPNTPTDTPTATSTESPTPTDTPVATDVPTSTPIPVSTPTNTPVATDVPTSTPTPVSTPTNTPDTGTFPFAPVADAYVDAEKPTTNAGASLSLRADGSPEMRSYLRFEVTGLSGSVIRARLRLYANRSHSVGYDARGVADSWEESAITYENAPPVGSVVGSSGEFTAGTWTEVDVTPLIGGNGTVSLAFTTSHSTAINLASRESGANAPQLIIETE